MRVALVHDYLKDFGGAERVLRVLSDMYPEAPIYTAFVTPGSTAAKAFADRKIVPWKHQWLINKYNLHSPLRFLIPLIWESFPAKGGQGFSDYDVVISSASGYITKSILTHPQTFHLCYCHTPPRFLYGYPTAREWRRYWPVRIGFQIVAHFLRQYDYLAAQRVDQFIANSQNTAKRIKKFYRCDSQVIYPPVEVGIENKKIKNQKLKTKNYFLVVSRVVGSKGWEILFQSAKKLPNINFKIVGESAGLHFSERKWRQAAGSNVEWLGRVNDEKLYKLYVEAKALLALAQDEDFGMTLVEAMAAGTPVIAYAGGGYLETVVEGTTGTFFHEYTSSALIKAIKNFKPAKYKSSDCRKQARKFSKERFEKEIRKLVMKGGIGKIGYGERVWSKI